MKIFLAPHHDDSVLWGSFTLLREKPLVLVVLDSYVQPQRGYKDGANEIREQEEISAVKGVYGCPVEFMHYRDDTPDWGAIEQRFYSIQNVVDIEHVWAPAVEEGGHAHHNAIGKLAAKCFPNQVTHYTTYTKSGKSVGRVKVSCEPEWIILKHRAMTCYRSQIYLENCREHFMRDLHEWYQ